MPAIMAEMMTPVMLWTHIVMMAKEQRPVVALPPYLDVRQFNNNLTTSILEVRQFNILHV